MYESLCWVLLTDFYWFVTWIWKLGFRLTWICFWGSNNKATWELDFQCSPLGFLWVLMADAVPGNIWHREPVLVRLRTGQDTGSPVLRHTTNPPAEILFQFAEISKSSLLWIGFFFSRWLKIGSPSSLLTHPVVSFQLFSKRQNSIGVGHEDVFSSSQKPMLNIELSLNIFQVGTRPRVEAWEETPGSLPEGWRGYRFQAVK